MERSNRPSKALTAVTTAGIVVALGAAGAVLYARSRRTTWAAALMSPQARSGSTKTPAGEVGNSTEDRTVEKQNGAPRAEEIEKQEDGASTNKQPCDGCDCGLNGGSEPPGPLEGTMHTYERHVIICSGHEEWPKMIEAEEASLAESLHNMCLGAGLIWTKKVAKAAAALGKEAAPNRVKITACTEPSRGPPGTTDVIVYPEGLVYSLDVDNFDRMETFVKVQLADRKVASALKPVPVSYQKMVLVCTHASRDKRCGRAGPQVLETMAKELETRGVREDQVALRGSSHFGGHKYAGVLIIYPQGDWYGLVNKKNAACIIDKCVLGTSRMKANWRGNMDNPGRKPEEPPTLPSPPPAEEVETPRVNGDTPMSTPKANGTTHAINGTLIVNDTAVDGTTPIANGSPPAVNGDGTTDREVEREISVALPRIEAPKAHGTNASADGTKAIERARRESLDSSCGEGA